MELDTYQALIQINCSSQLTFFLCAVVVPMCDERYPKPIVPCQSFCRNIEASCRQVVESFGFPWPEYLNCSNFPAQNTRETMCMEGEKQPERPKSTVSPQLSRCR